MLLRDEIEKLTPEGKLLLLEEIWSSLSTRPEHVPVSEDEQRELDRRFAAHQQDPAGTITLDELKHRLARRV